jgi:DNA-binding GntR family transcriptional regulator
MASGLSLSEKAYQYIRRQVFTGNLKPGDRLVNRTIASELDISFIPVREAISRLVSEGLVDQVPGVGAFVRDFGRQEISEIYDVRELFEPFAAGQAARFLTDHELAELEVLLNRWESLGKLVLENSKQATFNEMDRWLEFNEQFHSIMITASRNRLLAKITNNVHVLSSCFASHRGAPKLLSSEVIDSTIKSHRELLEKLKLRDSDGAEELVRRQLKIGRKNVLNFYDQE